MVIQGNAASDNGGGVYSTGQLTLIDSSVTGNYADNNGGGIWASDQLSILNSTVSGNTANFLGGGIRGFAANVSIENSTIAINSGFSGIETVDGTLTLSHSIISGSSGRQIEVAGTTNVTNHGFNLIGDSSQTTNAALNGFSLVPSDITATNDGTHPSALSDILDPTLAANGGTTLTHALATGSPAIDAGDVAISGPPLADQRGRPFRRIVDGNIDIGSFEFQQSLIVDSLENEDDGDYSVGDLGLREALAFTNANDVVDTVLFDSGLSGGVINLVGELVVSRSTTIDASTLPDGIRIHGSTTQPSRLFRISHSGETILAGMNLSNGISAASGGAIFKSGGGELTLNRMTISNSRTTGNSAPGGAIWSNGTLTLNQSTVSGNSTFGLNSRGGGIYASQLSLIQSTVTGNSTFGAGSRGGGISAASLLMNGTIVAGNNSAARLADVDMFGYGPLSVEYSLIGDADGGVISGPGNLIGDNQGAGVIAPMLAGLADNGGPVETHALMAGSPAFNAGDPNVVFDPMEFDQRGTPFHRVSGGRMDIGAVEQQVSDTALRLRLKDSDPSQLEFVDGIAVVASGPIPSVGSLIFSSLPTQSDSLTIDYSNGFFTIPDGIFFDGNLDDGDGLFVVGTGLTQVEYESTSGLLGTATIETSDGADTDTLAFANLDLVGVEDMLTFEANGLLNIGDDLLTIDAVGISLDTATLIDGGTLNVPNGISLPAGKFIQGSGTINGPFYGASGSRLIATGTLTVGDPNHFGGFATDGQILTGSHTVTLHDKDNALLGAYTHIDGGTLAAANGMLLPNGMTLEVSSLGGVINTNDGTDNNNFELQGVIYINGDMNTTLTMTGCLTGSGEVEGTGAFSPSCISPGNSPGIIGFEGDLNLSTDSQTVMELGGLQRGTQYDGINVGGVARLGGSFHIQPWDGFRPERGQSFDFLLGEHVGEFDSISHSPEFAGLLFELDYTNAAMVSLSVLDVLPGDANRDGYVDGSDFNVWNANKFRTGTDWSTGDFNGDGVTDGSDFNIWNANKFQGDGIVAPLPSWVGVENAQTELNSEERRLDSAAYAPLKMSDSLGGRDTRFVAELADAVFGGLNFESPLSTANEHRWRSGDGRRHAKSPADEFWSENRYREELSFDVGLMYELIASGDRS